MKHYQAFILNVLGTIEHLSSLESVFVMDELKHTYGIHFKNRGKACFLMESCKNPS